jgi:hypothetical protein
VEENAGKKIASVFESGKRAGMEDFEKERERLHSKISQLTVEVDFLKKNPNSSTCEACRAAAHLSVAVECL